MHSFSLDDHGSGSRVLQASSVRFLILSVMLGMGHRRETQACLFFAFSTLGGCNESRIGSGIEQKRQAAGHEAGLYAGLASWPSMR